ncbi:MAG: proline iminopeptidase [Planctomycetota bacterium]|jgi:proline iminopeptidase
MANEHFLEPREPFATGTLAVDDLHTLYYERCGNPEGIPILFVHGGPGAGCSTTDRRFFDAEKFHAILFDQRGCGRSKPLGELRDNTIEHLIADIERLREELGLEQWHVFGGSWGSTLSLCYAQAHPDRVLSLVLRGIWLLTAAELKWWLYGIRWIQPELWRDFAHHLPEEERDDLMEGYWRRLTGDDHEVALDAARHWSIYEGSCCTLLPNPEFTDAFAEDELAWNLARLEAHFFRAGIQPDNAILERVERLRQIPAFAVHGRYDIVCPVRSLNDLCRAWPELDYRVVPDAGHSSHEPGITRELVAATERIARSGSPLHPASER